MRRRILSLLLVIALGLQAPLASFGAALLASGDTGSSMMFSGCPMAAAHHIDRSKKSCCPDRERTAGCCMIVVGMMSSAVPFVRQPHFAAVFRFRIPAFTSRGDAPLIRPPIFATA